MIDKISDVRIRETSLEETPEVTEQPAQDNIAPEAEPLVHATPEHKSALIAEQRLGGQAQELLLREQLDSQIPSDDSDKAAFQNETRNPTSFKNARTPRETPKSGSEIVRETIKNLPDELGRQLGEMGKALSHPGDVISNAAENAQRILDDIKAGR